MRTKQKESFLINYYQEKTNYERLAEYIIHMIKDDPSAPNDNIHTIAYRLKNDTRLIEKIDDENKHRETDQEPITITNYKNRIGDLLGIRIICLRLADIHLVESYLNYLVEEKIIEFLKPPDPKQSFILPIDPGSAIPLVLSLRPSGYSSIHYQIRLHVNTKAEEKFKNLQVELQLRTLLEEAWGEIDHKYRYTHSRRGTALPDYIHEGFYNLSAYLQVAAQQAEYLCRQVESFQASSPVKARKSKIGSKELSFHIKGLNADGIISDIPSQFQSMLEEIFGFKLTARTLAYVYKRFEKFNFAQDPKASRKILTEKRLNIFQTILREILGREAFKDKVTRNIDVINTINFSLVDETQGRKISQEGLKSVLLWRKEHSKW